MRFTVGSVPYVNAIPLVLWFEELGDSSPVEVVFDVPSKLPELLDSGQADAILVSSVDALQTPGRRMAAGVCIGSHGPVKSVRLFSKRPIREIETLALDRSSMTSNRLAHIVLAERYGIEPASHPMAPDLAKMLEECDACVLIGDIGMVAESEGLHIIDLGDEWRRLTGKPFVWAAWIGSERLSSELAAWLQVASTISRAGRDLSLDSTDGLVARGLFRRYLNETEALQAPYERVRRQALIERAVSHGWSAPVVRDYFFNVMVYDMDPQVLEGFREFQRRLIEQGFGDCSNFPAMVAPGAAQIDGVVRELRSRGAPVPVWLESLG